MPSRFNRRAFAQTLAGSLSAMALADFSHSELLAQDTAAQTLASLNRFPRMMQEFLVGRVTEAHGRSVQAKQSLKTRSDAEQYVQVVREKIALCFGPHPEKTDLNARVTGVIDRDQYRVEKIIFDSRPKFPVTANLYLPKRIGKVPAVVGTCGHSANGKAAEAYQSFAQGLARQGYACLIYDPIGQGERLQYMVSGDDHGKSKYGVGVREHIQAGNQQFLVGDSLAMWRAWDGIRALDYLLTREEVDPQHIGVTGNSGGGTMTTWLCGIESRWTMAAPACFVTTFLHNAENELPADTEQCPTHALALGLEHEDFLAAMAPKPIVILTKERDFFDVRGGEEAFKRLKRLYTLLGKPDNIALHTGPTEHGYSIENREAMYGWFNRITGVSEAQREPEIVIESDEILQCTPTGQVASEQPATVFSMTRDKALILQKQRGQVAAGQLPNRILHVLNIAPELPSDPPDYRILRSVGNRKYPRRFSTTYAVETEPGVFALSYMLGDAPHDSRPPRDSRQAVLYVAHRSSDQELQDKEWLRKLITDRPEMPIFACDVRGIGESIPNTCGLNTFDDPYGCDYFYAIHGLMLDRAYLGQKTWDVLRVLQWMKSFGHEQIEVIASGWGALSASLAVVLSQKLLGEFVSSVTLHGALKSFHSLAIDEDYDMPLAYLPLDVLSHFDMPDCYAALPNLTQIGS
ncbi:MAG: acetylxylan esterase [Aureliella sp.]